MSQSSLVPTVNPTSSATRADGGEVQLRGILLRLLQALWLALVLCDLFVLIASLPAFYSALHVVCTTFIASCQDDQLTPQGVAALQHAGLSIHAYALYVFTWDLLTTLFFLLLGAVIFWRKAHTWMASLSRSSC